MYMLRKRIQYLIYDFTLVRPAAADRFPRNAPPGQNFRFKLLTPAAAVATIATYCSRFDSKTHYAHYNAHLKIINNIYKSAHSNRIIIIARCCTCCDTHRTRYTMHYYALSYVYDYDGVAYPCTQNQREPETCTRKIIYLSLHVIFVLTINIIVIIFVASI